MGAPPGGLTSRLLRPLIQHLTRQARRLPPAPSSSSSRAGRRTDGQRAYEDVKEFARDVWRGTFGDLQAGRERAYETIPLRRGPRSIGGRVWPGQGGAGGQARDYHRAAAAGAQTMRSSIPSLGRSTRFAGSAYRPALTAPAPRPRGAAMVGNAGMHPSPARTFVTYGPNMAREVFSGVPLGMRALADRLRKGDHDDGMSTRGRAKRTVKGGERNRGVVLKSLKRYERLHGGSRFGRIVGPATTEQDEKEARRAREYKRYFGRVEQSEVQAVGTDQPEEPRSGRTSPPSRDRNRTAYLLLPLAPSLSHLLSLPSPTEEKEREDPYTAHAPPPDLLRSLLPAQRAYDVHARTRLFPLLRELGKVVELSSEEGRWLRTTETVDVELVLGPSLSGTDERQEPEALRLIFRGWTEEGVERLIRRAESDDAAGPAWWAVYSVPHGPAPGSRRDAEAASESDLDFFDETGATGSGSSTIATSSLFTSTPGSYTPLSSYASSIRSDDDDAPSVTEEQDVWRMPVLTETGSVSGSSSLYAAGMDESELEWVEERIWGA